MCDCNHRAAHCHFDPLVLEQTKTGSGGVCEDCDEGTHGIHCEKCSTYYFRNILTQSCDPCRCDMVGSFSNECNPQNGSCPCRDGWEGRTCNKLKPSTVHSFSTWSSSPTASTFASSSSTSSTIANTTSTSGNSNNYNVDIAGSNGDLASVMHSTNFIAPTATWESSTNSEETTDTATSNSLTTVTSHLNSIKGVTSSSSTGSPAAATMATTATATASTTTTTTTAPSHAIFIRGTTPETVKIKPWTAEGFLLGPNSSHIGFNITLGDRAMMELAKLFFPPKQPTTTTS